MRIAVGQVTHETNTFSPIKTTIDTFRETEWGTGNYIFEKHEGVNDYLGGMIDCFKSYKVDILPTFSAYTPPSGIITYDTYLSLKNDLIAQLKRVEPFDGICLSLHGAGVAENVDDLEGALLKEIRNNFGYDIPIVVALDLHANVTELMVNEATMLLGVVEYPHIDSYECGFKAALSLIKIINHEFNPVMSIEKLPLLIPTYPTDMEPMNLLNDFCKEIEALDDVVGCTIFHGFPYTDIPNLGVSVLTTTNSNKVKSMQISKLVSQEIWKYRKDFNLKYPSPDQGVQEALKRDTAPVLINETSDNPGAGTPGDGTHLLKALLNYGDIKSCFGFISDRKVVDTAIKHGIGSYIEVLLGGNTDNLHGDPLKIRAYVKSITDGKFIQSSPMWSGLEVNIGPTVRLQVGKTDIIVSSLRNQTFDEQVFLLHGINIFDYKIIGIKSSVHFKASFKENIKDIITVDSPGLSTCNLHIFNYKKLNKSIYYPISNNLED
ncbi:M81 family metallopeptidase [Priestia megaterium]|uniref:M81 family metallopeptidase n=1 Tax=Priestia megaterium TaxID=1404 RepID=UPI00189DEB35|nr:M81 family metallopeptidase [Priestia megaterium]